MRERDLVVLEIHAMDDALTGTHAGIDGIEFVATRQGSSNKDYSEISDHNSKVVATPHQGA
jgi:hypothetical protein